MVSSEKRDTGRDSDVREVRGVSNSRGADEAGGVDDETSKSGAHRVWEEVEAVGVEDDQGGVPYTGSRESSLATRHRSHHPEGPSCIHAGTSAGARTSTTPTRGTHEVLPEGGVVTPVAGGSLVTLPGTVPPGRVTDGGGVPRYDARLSSGRRTGGHFRRVHESGCLADSVSVPEGSGDGVAGQSRRGSRDPSTSTSPGTGDSGSDWRSP